MRSRCTATVAEFAGDKIAAFRQYWDEVELLEQLALLPGSSEGTRARRVRSTGSSPGVADVVIDHPPTNLVDGAFVVALRDLLDALEHEAAARVLVFTSADPDFFLMHGDVHGILAIPPGAPPRATGPNVAAALFERLHRSHLVSIAAVDGAARGGGAEFLAAVDLRFGSERAVLGQPEVAMGILPGAGGTARLPHLLGRSRALEVILTGRDVGAEEAVRIGWLDRTFPHEALGREARSLAHHVAAMPAASIAAVKARRRQHLVVVRAGPRRRDRCVRCLHGRRRRRPDGAVPARPAGAGQGAGGSRAGTRSMARRDEPPD